MPPRRRAAPASASTEKKARPSKLAKENNITAEQEAEIKEAYHLFAVEREEYEDEKEGVIPRGDIRRCMVYALSPPPIITPNHSADNPLQRPRNPTLEPRRTRRDPRRPRPRAFRPRNLRALPLHLRAQTKRAHRRRDIRGGGESVRAVYEGREWADYVGAFKEDSEGAEGGCE
jgi:hypothetical protein